MTFRYSQVAAGQLLSNQRMVEDLRNSPIARRSTKFRLMQQNILAYTFDEVVPGWTSPGLNSMPFKEVVDQGILNAREEGLHAYQGDFDINSNAVAKVTGDIYEVLTSAVMWNAAAAWNEYMWGGSWPSSPRYARPKVGRSPRRMVTVLNLPRRYDWVRLLDKLSKERIKAIRDELAERELSMPTSTPDMAVIVLPESERDDPIWRTPIPHLSPENQTILRDAHKRVAGKVQPGEIILAIALKSSLRSDRLYQPLYEANVMQLLLEGYLGAPRVEFEVHALTAEGTGAVDIYRAATLHSAGTPFAHRAVRELYEPQNASQVVTRFLSFLEGRMADVTP